LRASGGVMINLNTAYPDKPAIFPGIDLSYGILKGTRVFASFNRALHLPTFTDLFYTDPVNQGNFNLNPNQMVTWEAGIKYEGKNTIFNMAYFRNNGKDIIDWLWSYEMNRFRPVNLAQYTASGYETSIFMHFDEGQNAPGFLRSASVSYQYINIHKSVPDSVSKYYNLTHKLSLTLRHQIVWKFDASWNISYQDRAGEWVGFSQEENKYFTTPYQPYWLFDGAINWSSKHFELFAAISNILNTRYIDAGSEVQPGRWFKGGVRVKFRVKESK
jgi:iron complex outermembrane receptor protein